ncbi:MAG: GPW/gp25 family protein [Chitinophagaceae bacterium]
MYYKIPFNFSEVMEGQDAKECNIHESIAQHLHVLITTRFGENRYDNNYGNAIWELEFDRSMSNAQWEEKFKIAVSHAIDTYEPRLMNNKVTIYTEMVEKTWPLKKYTEIKKKVTVLVQSLLAADGEKYSFTTALYLSPMSVD